MRLCDVKDRNVNWVSMLAPVEDVGKDHLIADVKWATDIELAITWMSRKQNVSVLLICHADTGFCQMVNGTINHINEFFLYV